MSIRERIKAIEKVMRDDELTPGLAREYEAELAGLLGSCIEERRLAEIAYKPVLLKCLQSGGAANKAKIEAECSLEFAWFLETKDATERVKQMLITCRGHLRSLTEEMRLTRG